MLLDQLSKIRGGLLNVLRPLDMFSKIFGGWRVQVSPKHKPYYAKYLKRSPSALLALDR